MAVTDEIMKMLLSDNHDFNANFEILQKLKGTYKPPDKIFSKIRLESLLESARITLESQTEEVDLLRSYGAALVNFVGKEPLLNPEVMCQLEMVLLKLQKEDKETANSLIKRLWMRLEAESVFPSDGILKVSNRIMEEKVLDWIEAEDPPEMEFLARMCAESPKLFRALTAIFYEVSVQTRGHAKVLQLTEAFVEMVMSACRKYDKDFLGLYPKDCRRLVALLMVPPECFEDVSDVVSLLEEMFWTGRIKALALLSHYSNWMRPFKKCLRFEDECVVIG